MERDAVRMDFRAYNIISTHTLTWSVTLLNCPLDNFSINFNSHAHVERDFRF